MLMSWYSFDDNEMMIWSWSSACDSQSRGTDDMLMIWWWHDIHMMIIMIRWYDQDHDHDLMFVTANLEEQMAAEFLPFYPVSSEQSEWLVTNWSPLINPFELSSSSLLLPLSS